jgi:AhpD family alkylhydroperoxidase
MHPRLSYPTIAPNVLHAALNLSKPVHECGLEQELIELVNMRASQINGCAYCLDMHAKALRKMGVDQQKLDLLVAWREAPGFSEREQAALAWAEAVTLVAGNGVPEDVYRCALSHFGEKGLVDLTYAVTVINTWNRLNVSFRNAPPS